MHIGNARTALFNFLVAQSMQGVFLLRIEDTDQARSEYTFAEELMADLNWLGISWQEGPNIEGPHAPYWQSQRQEVYEAYYEKLIERDLAYPCFCSDDELNLQRKIQISRGQPPRYSGVCRKLAPEQVRARLKEGEPATLRFSVPQQAEIIFDDLVRGRQVFLSQNLGDFIIRRADGTASFLFCNAVDDALMGVSMALRGDDHLSNTPKQLLVMKALGLTPPQYGHISMILGDDGAPLSKRNGSMSIGELRASGFLAESVLNYLARLGHYYEQNGWLNQSELALFFQAKNLGASPARFDHIQLMHWQREGVLRLDFEAFWHWCGASIKSMIPEAAAQDFFMIIRGNVLFPHEVKLWAEILYQEIHFNEEALACICQASKVYFEKALELSAISDFKSFVKNLGQALGIKGKALYEPLRIALTGQNHGPELLELQKLLGNEKVLNRLQQALAICL
jgi:nondiscriminating glutamyl-tRNA synthetase